MWSKRYVAMQYVCALRTDVENRMRKALSARENCVPSFSSSCRTCRTRPRAGQVHAVTLICSASRASTDAHMLHAVAICARAAGAAAIFKGSWPFFTDNMLAHHAVVEVLDDHRQSSK